jgi:hypothetical protein
MPPVHAVLGIPPELPVHLKQLPSIPRLGPLASHCIRTICKRPICKPFAFNPLQTARGVVGVLTESFEIRSEARYVRRQRDEEAVTASPSESAFTNCDVCKFFRIRFYENCRGGGPFFPFWDRTSCGQRSTYLCSPHPAQPRAEILLGFSLHSTFSCRLSTVDCQPLYSRENTFHWRVSA